MTLRPIVIDTGLLTLLVVGLASRTYIGKHSGTRSRRYSLIDYSDLLTLLDARKIILVPHVLTETHHFVDSGENPMRGLVKQSFASVVIRYDERPAASRIAVERPEFKWLGLTDAVLLTVAESDAELLTDDGLLFKRASESGYSATNFTDIRARRL